jgi:hypothetical protein
MVLGQSALVFHGKWQVSRLFPWLPERGRETPPPGSRQEMALHLRESAARHGGAISPVYITE